MRAVVCAAVSMLVLLGCDIRDEEEARQPEAYIVAGDVVLELDSESTGDHTFRGHFSAGYVLEDAVLIAGTEIRKVRLHRLQAWLDDRHISLGGVRTRRQALFCTELSINRAMRGVVFPNGRLSFEDGAVIGGASYEEHNENGGCPGAGSVLVFGGTTDRAFGGWHDPVANEFSLAGGFDDEIGGEDIDGMIELTGYFVNRPPTAVVASAAEPVFNRMDGGCPPTKVAPNDPHGLKAVFESRSHDPDGDFSRADIAREQWSRYQGLPDTAGVPYEFMGRGHRVDTVLFEAGETHTVVLGVFDRRGARSEARCTFYVSPSEARGRESDDE